MTNGEKLEQVFPDGICPFSKNWLDYEYKEPTTKNCESCRYYGSHHEVCNYCYNFSLWTEQEPTTKNDLGVDKSILALLEKTYTDFYKCAGGEGWFEIDGKTYGTDAGYALEGMDIFMEVFKQRLAESEPQESEDKE